MRLASLTSGNGMVVLNVYDLHENNDTLLTFGLGLFHSGVQLNGREYTFASQGGIFNHEPKNVPTARFRESIPIGEFKGTSRDIDRILDELKPQFKGSDYNILLKNCNSFADAFVQRLCNRPIPSYVNRMANLGSFFSCLLPPSVTGEAPVDTGDSQTSSASSSGYAVGRYGSASSSSSATKPFSGQGRRLGDK